MLRLFAKAFAFAGASGVTPLNLTIFSTVLLVFWLTPGVFRKLHGAADRLLGRLTVKRWAAVLIAAVLPVALRIAFLPWYPIPSPSIHDEFSYLLASDTFAHGRVTNPSHPLFQFFETFHVLPLPTYMSKYPPVQSLLLAAGQAVFGHPFWGVLLSIGFMAGASCWALQGWLPGRWAFLGAVALGLQFGVGHSWANSYWGGAPAAIGACLLLGAFARLKQYRPFPNRPVLHGLLFSLGIVMLLNSRPWEGAAVIAPIGIAALAWLFSSSRALRTERIRTVLLPATAMLFVCATAMLYYNFRITGNALSMPYTVVHKTYSVAPLFVWQPRTPEPEYRHAVMKRFYTEFEPTYQDADKAATLRGWLSLQPGRIRMAKDLLFGNFFLFLCVAFVFFRPGNRLWLLLMVLAVFAAALDLESWNQIHYFGPIIAVTMVLKMSALQRLSVLSFRGSRIGIALATGILLCSAVRLAQGAAEFPHVDAFALQRAAIQQELESKPGSHVVLVRYSTMHLPHEEWVYNAANIDNSKVVWAREMTATENQKLLQYFQGRSFWLIAPDEDPSHLQAVPNNVQPISSASGSAIP